MTNEAKIELFENMPIPKAVAKLSIPCIVSALVMVVYNLVDTYFVGQLNDPVQNAAVTLVAPIMLSFMAVSNLFGSGTSSYMSRSLGRKDYDSAKKASAFGFYSALFLALLFTFMFTAGQNLILNVLGADEYTIDATKSYMFWTVTLGCVPSILSMVLATIIRSEGASLHSSIGSMSGCFLNMILDPIFIMPWGLNMGVKGAGMATCISNAATVCYFLFYVLSHKRDTFVCLDIRRYAWEKRIALDIFSVGVPASIQNILNVAGMSVFTKYTSLYGADALAAMGIAQKINQIPWNITLGASMGVMPLIGYNYSSGNHKRMKNSFYFTFFSAIGLVMILALGCYINSYALVGTFIDSKSVIDYGSAFLRGFLVGLPFLVIDFVGLGLFQAIGRGKFTLFFAICRKLVLEIPALIILNHVYPPYSLAYAQFCAEFILSIISIVVVQKLFRSLKKSAE